MKSIMSDTIATLLLNDKLDFLTWGGLPRTSRVLLHAAQWLPLSLLPWDKLDKQIRKPSLCVTSQTTGRGLLLPDMPRSTKQQQNIMASKGEANHDPRFGHNIQARLSILPHDQ